MHHDLVHVCFEPSTLLILIDQALDKIIINVPILHFDQFFRTPEMHSRYFTVSMVHQKHYLSITYHRIIFWYRSGFLGKWINEIHITKSNLEIRQ